MIFAIYSVAIEQIQCHQNFVNIENQCVCNLFLSSNKTLCGYSCAEFEEFENNGVCVKIQQKRDSCSDSSQYGAGAIYDGVSGCICDNDSGFAGTCTKLGTAACTNCYANSQVVSSNACVSCQVKFSASIGNNMLIYSDLTPSRCICNPTFGFSGSGPLGCTNSCYDIGLMVSDDSVSCILCDQKYSKTGLVFNPVATSRCICNPNGEFSGSSSAGCTVSCYQQNEVVSSDGLTCQKCVDRFSTAANKNNLVFATDKCICDPDGEFAGSSSGCSVSCYIIDKLVSSDGLTCVDCSVKYAAADNAANLIYDALAPKRCKCDHALGFAGDYTGCSTDCFQANNVVKEDGTECQFCSEKYGDGFDFDSSKQNKCSCDTVNGWAGTNTCTDCTAKQMVVSDNAEKCVSCSTKYQTLTNSQYIGFLQTGVCGCDQYYGYAGTILAPSGCNISCFTLGQIPSVDGTECKECSQIYFNSEFRQNKCVCGPGFAGINSICVDCHAINQIVSKDGSQCVLCQSLYGFGSIYNQTTKQCVCDVLNGFTASLQTSLVSHNNVQCYNCWNQGQETTYDVDIISSSCEGPCAEVFDPVSHLCTSCSAKNMYFDPIKKCVSCSDQYGVGSVFDFSQKMCACDTQQGYASTLSNSQSSNFNTNCVNCFLNARTVLTGLGTSACSAPCAEIFDQQSNSCQTCASKGMLLSLSGYNKCVSCKDVYGAGSIFNSTTNQCVCDVANGFAASLSSTLTAHSNVQCSSCWNAGKEIQFDANVLQSSCKAACAQLFDPITHSCATCASKNMFYDPAKKCVSCQDQFGVGSVFDSSSGNCACDTASGYAASLDAILVSNFNTRCVNCFVNSRTVQTGVGTSACNAPCAEIFDQQSNSCQTCASKSMVLVTSGYNKCISCRDLYGTGSIFNGSTNKCVCDVNNGYSASQSTILVVHSNVQCFSCWNLGQETQFDADILQSSCKGACAEIFDSVLHQCVTCASKNMFYDAAKKCVSCQDQFGVGSIFDSVSKKCACDVQSGFASNSGPFLSSNFDTICVNCHIQARTVIHQGDQTVCSVQCSEEYDQVSNQCITCASKGLTLSVVYQKCISCKDAFGIGSIFNQSTNNCVCDVSNGYSASLIANLIPHSNIQCYSCWSNSLEVQFDTDVLQSSCKSQCAEIFNQETHLCATCSSKNLFYDSARKCISCQDKFGVGSILDVSGQCACDTSSGYAATLSSSSVNNFNTNCVNCYVNARTVIIQTDQSGCSDPCAELFDPITHSCATCASKNMFYDPAKKCVSCQDQFGVGSVFDSSSGNCACDTASGYAASLDAILVSNFNTRCVNCFVNSRTVQTGVGTSACNAPCAEIFDQQSNSCQTCASKSMVLVTSGYNKCISCRDLYGTGSIFNGSTNKCVCDVNNGYSASQSTVLVVHSNVQCFSCWNLGQETQFDADILQSSCKGACAEIFDSVLHQCVTCASKNMFYDAAKKCVSCQDQFGVGSIFDSVSKKCACNTAQGYASTSSQSQTNNYNTNCVNCFINGRTVLTGLGTSACSAPCAEIFDQQSNSCQTCASKGMLLSLSGYNKCVSCKDVYGAGSIFNSTTNQCVCDVANGFAASLSSTLTAHSNVQCSSCWNAGKEIQFDANVLQSSCKAACAQLFDSITHSCATCASKNMFYDPAKKCVSCQDQFGVGSVFDSSSGNCACDTASGYATLVSNFNARCVNCFVNSRTVQTGVSTSACNAPCAEIFDPTSRACQLCSSVNKILDTTTYKKCTSCQDLYGIGSKFDTQQSKCACSTDAGYAATASSTPVFNYNTPCYQCWSLQREIILGVGGKTGCSENCPEQFDAGSHVCYTCASRGLYYSTSLKYCIQCQQQFGIGSVFSTTAKGCVCDVSSGYASGQNSLTQNLNVVCVNCFNQKLLAITSADGLSSMCQSCNLQYQTTGLVFNPASPYNCQLAPGFAGKITSATAISVVNCSVSKKVPSSDLLTCVLCSDLYQNSAFSDLVNNCTCNYQGGYAGLLQSCQYCWTLNLIPSREGSSCVSCSSVYGDGSIIKPGVTLAAQQCICNSSAGYASNLTSYVDLNAGYNVKCVNCWQNQNQLTIQSTQATTCLSCVSSFFNQTTKICVPCGTNEFFYGSSCVCDFRKGFTGLPGNCFCNQASGFTSTILNGAVTCVCNQLLGNILLTSFSANTALTCQCSAALGVSGSPGACYCSGNHAGAPGSCTCDSQRNFTGVVGACECISGFANNQNACVSCLEQQMEAYELLPRTTPKQFSCTQCAVNEVFQNGCKAKTGMVLSSTTYQANGVPVRSYICDSASGFTGDAGSCTDCGAKKQVADGKSCRACATDEIFENSVCVKCATRNAKVLNGQCKCLDGFGSPDSTKQCVKCASTQKMAVYNPVTEENSCVSCSPLQQFDGQTCKCTQTGFENVNGYCVCSAGTIQSGNQCVDISAILNKSSGGSAGLVAAIIVPIVILMIVIVIIWFKKRQNGSKSMSEVLDEKMKENAAYNNGQMLDKDVPENQSFEQNGNQNQQGQERNVGNNEQIIPEDQITVEHQVKYETLGEQDEVGLHRLEEADEQKPTPIDESEIQVVNERPAKEASEPEVKPRRYIVVYEKEDEDIPIIDLDGGYDTQNNETQNEQYEDQYTDDQITL
ncbi:proprotein_convertase subtilisin/kexin type 5-like [Hexamita inflata]|uniref:Proprotein convertase subtilisin/kexin type 5-like n=1 Tax=Hexamita inflata TaxID=28002 RepID=A0AA86UME3_9EUKA|nr:proprotein convertase subtilisin/kexin type 5-like [Hexamita inflata]